MIPGSVLYQISSYLILYYFYAYFYAHVKLVYCVSIDSPQSGIFFRCALCPMQMYSRDR
jgi:hypothetical protein